MGGQHGILKGYSKSLNIFEEPGNSDPRLIEGCELFIVL